MEAESFNSLFSGLVSGLDCNVLIEHFTPKYYIEYLIDLVYSEDWNLVKPEVSVLMSEETALQAEKKGLYSYRYILSYFYESAIPWLNTQGQDD